MVRDVSKDYSGIAILENLNLEMFIAITHDVQCILVLLEEDYCV